LFYLIENFAVGDFPRASKVFVLWWIYISIPFHSAVISSRRENLQHL
jgi:hypothetical protein